MKAPTDTHNTKIANGRITLCNEIPADLKETNSKCSPKFPNVIRDASNTERGNANGTTLAEENNNNSAITYHSIPLPSISSTYNQINCINSTNTEIKKVSTNGPIKERSINFVSFFTLEMIRTNIAIHIYF